MRVLRINESYIEQAIDAMRAQLSAIIKPGTSEIVYKQSLSYKAEEKAELHFDEAAYYKIKDIVDIHDKEIAWDCTVTRDPENPKCFYVHDVIMYPQIVTATTVDTDDERYTAWLNSLDDETFNSRRFNGHSHVRMAVSPSLTDKNYREDSITNVSDFFIYGIFNKSGDRNFEIYDVENNVVYENTDIDYYIPVPCYKDWAKEQIAQYIEVPKPLVSAQANNYSYSQYNQSQTQIQTGIQRSQASEMAANARMGDAKANLTKAGNSVVDKANKYNDSSDGVYEQYYRSLGMV